MFKRFAHNLIIKIICLLVAASLWVYVSASHSMIGKFPSSLNIKAINVPNGLTAIYDDKSVEIKIMADPGVWRQLSAKSFSAYVDLSGLGEGTFEMPVTIVCSVPNVIIVEKNPSSILVNLEPVISKEVPINKKVEGSAGEGLVAGGVNLTPNTVTVKGAKSLIDNLNEGSVVIALNGETEDFSRNVPLLGLDDKGEVISDIEFFPDQVKADVSIIKASNNKTVGVKVKTSGLPKNNAFVSSITVTPSTVDITGHSSLLFDINYVETSEIDLSTIDSTATKDVGLNLASGVALQAGLSSKVRVKITLTQGEFSKELSALVSYQNIPNNLRVSNLNPGQIKVVVSGELAKVNNLKSSDIILQIDLSGKVTGNNNFNLATGNFNVPEGVKITSISPSSVMISLESK